MLTRNEAIELGKSTYDGKPCKTCNNTLKYVSSYGCVACKKASQSSNNKAYWQKIKDAGRSKEYSQRGAEARKKYYDNNKEILKKRLHEKKSELGPFYIRKLLTSIKSKCKQKDIPFKITEQDVNIPDVCPVLGIPLRFNVGLSNNDDSPSIDRIIPHLGYVPGNIVVVSRRANKIKNDASSNEILMVYNFYKDKC